VLVRERERPGEPPLRQAERLADGLAMAGLDDVRTMVALALRADGAEGDGAFGQVAATLQDGLAGVRLLRLATTVAAAGTLRSA